MRLSEVASQEPTMETPRNHYNLLEGPLARLSASSQQYFLASITESAGYVLSGSVATVRSPPQIKTWILHTNCVPKCGCRRMSGWPPTLHNRTIQIYVHKLQKKVTLTPVQFSKPIATLTLWHLDLQTFSRNKQTQNKNTFQPCGGFSPTTPTFIKLNVIRGLAGRGPIPRRLIFMFPRVSISE